MDARDDRRHTVLMAAAGSGSPAMVQEILKSFPDVNANSSVSCIALAGAAMPGECKQMPENDGHTALMEAAWGDDHGNIPAEGLNRAEVVRLLLAAGADVNARDALGLTPLALSTHNPGIVRLLLEAGADPNVRNIQGLGAWDRAPNDEVKRMLAEHGAVPGTKKAGKE
jgi:ankyrin repeat protein